MVGLGTGSRIKGGRIEGHRVELGKEEAEMEGRIKEREVLEDVQRERKVRGRREWEHENNG